MNRVQYMLTFVNVSAHLPAEAQDTCISVTSCLQKFILYIVLVINLPPLYEGVREIGVQWRLLVNSALD